SFGVWFTRWTSAKTIVRGGVVTKRASLLAEHPYSSVAASDEHAPVARGLHGDRHRAELLGRDRDGALRADDADAAAGASEADAALGIDNDRRARLGLDRSEEGGERAGIGGPRRSSLQR